MEITIQDIIEKYNTNINTKSMSNKLKETILISDDTLKTGYFWDDNVTFEDIPQPTHKTEKYNGHTIDEYTYNFKKYTVIISFSQDDYRSMEVQITKPTPEYSENPVTEYRFNYKGEEWGIRY